VTLVEFHLTQDNQDLEVGLEDSIANIVSNLQEQRDAYQTNTLDSQAFKDALCYLEGMTSDFLMAQTCVRLMGTRFSAHEKYLLFRFAPYMAESAIAVTAAAKEGLQNSARRELRFLLEASTKLSSRDFHPDAKTFDERMNGLADRSQKFSDYIVHLDYFDGFENPEDANQATLSLYSDLSRFVHPTATQFRTAMGKSKRNESPGMESVATLNAFNRLTFQVYDLALVRFFHSLGLSIAGDIFVQILDGESAWRFHKGKFTQRLSRCFDYKHERRVKLEQS
jgi:hypothetical protein